MFFDGATLLEKGGDHVTRDKTVWTSVRGGLCKRERFLKKGVIIHLHNFVRKLPRKN